MLQILFLIVFILGINLLGCLLLEINYFWNRNLWTQLEKILFIASYHSVSTNRFKLSFDLL